MTQFRKIMIKQSNIFYIVQYFRLKSFCLFSTIQSIFGLIKKFGPVQTILEPVEGQRHKITNSKYYRKLAGFWAQGRKESSSGSSGWKASWPTTWWSRWPPRWPSGWPSQWSSGWSQVNFIRCSRVMAKNIAYAKFRKSLLIW